MTKFALLVMVVAACGKSEKAAPKGEAKPAEAKPAETAPAAPATPPAAPAPAADLGSCNFEISGAVTAKETTPGGLMAVSMSYWSDEKAKKMLFGDGEGFIVNCNGKGATISLTAAQQTKETVPMGPKKYELKKSMDSVVQQIGRAGESSLMGAEGTFEVTALDDAHFAGTFEFKSKVLGKDTTGEATIKGSFDFKRPR